MTMPQGLLCREKERGREKEKGRGDEGREESGERGMYSPSIEWISSKIFVGKKGSETKNSL